MKARIYKPAKSPMQSGRGKSRSWILEYETESARVPEPLMGWVSSEDTLHQVRVPFQSLDAAVAFADEHKLEYEVLEDHTRQIRPRSYLDNFKYTPAQE